MPRAWWQAFYSYTGNIGEQEGIFNKNLGIDIRLHEMEFMLERENFEVSESYS